MKVSAVLGRKTQVRDHHRMLEFADLSCDKHPLPGMIGTWQLAHTFSAVDGCVELGDHSAVLGSIWFLQPGKVVRGGGHKGGPFSGDCVVLD